MGNLMGAIRQKSGEKRSAKESGNHQRKKMPIKRNQL